MRNNKKEIYEEYNKIKKDTNNDVKIKKITQKLLNITGYEVKDNGTIFEFENANPYGLKKDYYGDIMQQVEVLENENKIVITQDEVIKTINKYGIKENDTPITIASKIISSLKLEGSFLSFGGEKSQVLIFKNPINNIDIDYDILITPKGIKETFTNRHFFIDKSKTIQKAKIGLMEQLDTLIETSKLTVENEISRNNKTITYDVFMNSAIINNGNYLILFKVQKTENSSMFYIHSLEIIKEEGADRPQMEHISLNPSSDDSINDKIEIVKKRINGIKDEG